MSLVDTDILIEKLKISSPDPEGVDDLIKIINELDQEQPKHYWIKHSWDSWECPICHNESGLYSDRGGNYCPDCGKRLFIPQESEEK